MNILKTDATNFFFIESYGYLLIKNASFTNASNKAVHFFLTDENISPDKATIDNCTFIDNSSPLEGGGLSIQGSKETSYQFTLNFVINNTIFINNTAGSKLVFSKLF